MPHGQGGKCPLLEGLGEDRTHAPTELRCPGHLQMHAHTYACTKPRRAGNLQVYAHIHMQNPGMQGACTHMYRAQVCSPLAHTYVQDPGVRDTCMHGEPRRPCSPPPPPQCTCACRTQASGTHAALTPWGRTLPGMQNPGARRAPAHAPAGVLWGVGRRRALAQSMPCPVPRGLCGRGG